jgi:hypothetical protein
MVKVLSTLIATLVTISIAGIVFAQGASTSVTDIGAPASAGGTPAGAGTYTPTPSGNAPAIAEKAGIPVEYSMYRTLEEARKWVEREG